MKKEMIQRLGMVEIFLVDSSEPIILQVSCWSMSSSKKKETVKSAFAYSRHYSREIVAISQIHANHISLISRRLHSDISVHFSVILLCNRVAVNCYNCWKSRIMFTNNL